ncbi:prolipoprotein diacylglyceryl transferase [Candidatus Curtissbacteria bacterium RIFCSPHIGHO2_01_FULL_41_44]|uniref:Phosphatidylglycerol--prolipoprotein diacylglyceryl transferase n=1 Tax=Candidatus Curtissbacteria bacterium RIFCSPLOWO2_01_FULL_42_50 TaxID=1797730 RepID=A0A1F5H3Y6_9BACT|nr:MAG: prolipoprotein diacylglyceryl transferase [Candidatus Curtissbacteria bacterium RIFCSPHIGHO2_01_FULL_41_44]OGD94457.1 MAG: prolipoprotein diacylglyceryl transferase [Candidatus Curtissbacteria bacterium RIFCSPHIGHO2_02_FULL_42_58]OGD97532.1 MAG: prolipoprotein diacylglyceryl transferase [Candidatus Curtissbacteria bacterium RIFCSPHIGHO2_12_FULL_42_33]OGD98754.1 MAG: prolipoprotein diacylglyceryl transferase [Candidatus Curtissbacteria bacterium RIFCSPLOWO2_01_FULL_42_50]OGE03771.1 MAG: 
MLLRSINIGPLTIHLYGLIIALSIYLGWLLAKKRAHIYKIPQKIFDDPILLVPLAFAIFGARLYHVLDLRDYYLAHKSLIFAIWNGGLGIWGALIGAFIGFWVISKVKNVNLLSILDLAAPSLLLGQSIGRIGNFLNQEAFGPPTGFPWGVYISPGNRPIQFANSTRFHPTFFYEAAIDLVFLVLLLFLTRKLRISGQTFSLYLIFYATGRFIVEFWRIDTWVVGSVKVAQILAVLTLIFGVATFMRARHKP